MRILTHFGIEVTQYSILSTPDGHHLSRSFQRKTEGCSDGSGLFLYRRYNLYGQKNISKIVWRNQSFHIHLQCTRSSEATFGWPKSEKGIRCESGTIPVAVYLGSRSGSLCLLHSLPLVKYWEGATSEMSQKTYLCI